MKPNRKQLISKRARTLLRESGVTSPPVPVDRICKTLGAQVRFSPLDDELSGMIYVKDDVPIVGINALHHPNRQRFTMAHECGHLVLHKEAITKQVHVDKKFPMLMRDSVSAAGVDEMEIEANFFAAELLMPKELLMTALEDTPFDIDDEDVVGELARRFRVSPAAMRFRLGNLFA